MYRNKLVYGLGAADSDMKIILFTWFKCNHDLLNVILWSDKSNFNNYWVSELNRKNDHFWVTKNGCKIWECKFQNRVYINVWLWGLDGKILGPYFYQRSLMGERYANFLLTEFERLFGWYIPRNMSWYVVILGWGPPHNSRNIKNILN